MGWILLAHLIIPFVFGLGFLVLAFVTGPEKATGTELTVEAALDMCILSIGATAAIFENPRLQELFNGSASEIIGTLIALNFLLSAGVIALRRSIYRKGVSIRRKRVFASASLVFGVLTMITVSLPVVYAFRHPTVAIPKTGEKK